MFIEMGELFAELGELFPDFGELFPELGEMFPELGQLFPELSEMFPELGEFLPELGELFPEVVEMFPELGEMHTRFHTARHILSPVILRYNTVLYTMYVPVINFDRAQFLTETRANNVDVQLCMVAMVFHTVIAYGGFCLLHNDGFCEMSDDQWRPQ